MVGAPGPLGAVVPVQTRISGSQADVASGHEPIVVLNTAEDGQTNELAIPQRRLP